MEDKVRDTLNQLEEWYKEIVRLLSAILAK